jgi:hypothetical protein
MSRLHFDDITCFKCFRISNPSWLEPMSRLRFDDITCFKCFRISNPIAEEARLSTDTEFRNPALQLEGVLALLN